VRIGEEGKMRKEDSWRVAEAGRLQSSARRGAHLPPSAAKRSDCGCVGLSSLDMCGDDILSLKIP